MTKVKNKLLAFLLLVFAISLIVFGCHSGPEDVDGDAVNIDTGLQKQINSYIEDKEAHQVRGGKSFAEHKLYGTAKKNGEIYVYLWSYFQEYYAEAGELQKGGGGSYPLVIVLEETEDREYQVIGHYRPEVGSDYTASIRDLFPEKFHEQIFSRPDIEELSSAVEEKAREYYDLIMDIAGEAFLVYFGPTKTTSKTLELVEKDNKLKVAAIDCPGEILSSLEELYEKAVIQQISELTVKTGYDDGTHPLLFIC